MLDFCLANENQFWLQTLWILIAICLCRRKGEKGLLHYLNSISTSNQPSSMPTFALKHAYTPEVFSFWDTHCIYLRRVWKIWQNESTFSLFNKALGFAKNPKIPQWKKEISAPDFAIRTTLIWQFVNLFSIEWETNLSTKKYCIC